MNSTTRRFRALGKFYTSIASLLLLLGSFAQPAKAQSSTQGSSTQGSATKAQGSTTQLPGSATKPAGSSTKPSGSMSKESGGQQDGFGLPGQQLSYTDLVAQIRKNEDEINHLFSSMPIGFPKKQQDHLLRIEELKKLNVTLSSQLDEAAYAAYQLDPQNSVKAGQLVFRQMTRKLDPQNSNHTFDPRGALEIAKTMMKAGLDNGTTPNAVQFRDVAYQAFRASYAIQDFDRAQLMLQKIEEQGIQIRPHISDKLNDTAEKWKKELMIRRHESDTKDLPIVKFETTEGTFEVELFENHAPQTVGNFVNLVEQGFYNDKPFFLVQPGKFAQSGCPVGNGSGDAGYRIACECYREKIRHHFTGTLSMANGGRDTASSQFFITQQPNPQWDGKYTAFGRVTKGGMDVVYKLKMADKTKLSAQEAEASKILRITVVSKRAHEYMPTKIPKETPGYGQPTDGQNLRTAQDFNGS